MVPEGWDKRTLASLADYHNGRAFKPQDWRKEGVPIIRIAQMTNPIAETDFYSGDDIEAKHKINNGDILFSWSATLAVMVWNRGPAVLNQHIFKVEEKPGIYSDFLYYLLDNSIDSLAEHSHGSTMKHIKKGVLKDFIVLVPSLHEQKKIADILSSVDNTIQATQAVIDQTRRVKQGLLQQLLTRGIGHVNLEEKEINQLPKGWKWVNLGDVTNESKQRNDGSFSDNDLYAVTKLNGLIPMRERVRGKNLNRCKVVLPAAFAYNPMRLNIGSIGQWSGDKPVIVSPDYVVFECNSSKIDSSYLNYIRKSHAWTQFMENAGNGSVRIRIYYKNLADFQLPLPPLQEQKQIVNILKGFDEVLKVEQKKLEQSLIIKRGLMQDLLTGRVRVKLDGEATT